MADHSGRAELAPLPDWTARYLVHKDSTQRSFVLSVGEGFAYNVRVDRAGRTVTSAVGENPDGSILFKLPALKSGSYRVFVRVSAQTTPGRVTTFAKTFRVGTDVRV